MWELYITRLGGSRVVWLAGRLHRADERVLSLAAESLLRRLA